METDGDGIGPFETQLAQTGNSRMNQATYKIEGASVTKKTCSSLFITH